MSTPSPINRRSFLARTSRGVAFLPILVAAASARAYDANSSSEVNVDAAGLAMQGYDPVSYFGTSGPVKGHSQFLAQHAGATYWFASAQNRDAFVASPGKYVPAFGGFCAMGVALEKKLDVDPHAWRVVGGRLYLNVNRDVQKRWLDDVPGNISKAESTWPRLKAMPPKAL